MEAGEDSSSILLVSLHKVGGWVWAPRGSDTSFSVTGHGGHKSCFLGLDKVVLASYRTVRSLGLLICPKLTLLCAPNKRFTLDMEAGQPCHLGPVAFII